MKVRIRKRFRDKDTGKLMIVGYYAEYEDRRAHELVRSGFVEIQSENDSTEKIEFSHIPKSESTGPVRRGRKPKS